MLTETDTPASPEALHNPGTAFTNAVDKLAEKIPEIAEQRDAIEQSGKELLEEFDIKTELFEDTGKSLFFTTLAERYSALENSKTSLSLDVYTAEKELIADATMLLAGKESGLFADAEQLIDASEQNETQTDAIYERFTNKEVSEELHTAINNGLLKDIKDQLGVTEANEDAFTVRVLNIGDESTMHGLADLANNHLVTEPQQSPGWREYFADERALAAYKKTMTNNLAELQRELGITTLPPAWVTHPETGGVINIPLPIAEKILYTDQPRSRSYDDYDRKRDIATLEHEYVHTQGGLTIGNDMFFGMTIEEYRAEFFSGNKNGYQDVKGFLKDFELVSGVNIPGYMASHLKGGTPEDFYTMVAQKIGLQNTLELALTVPNKYIAPERKLQANIAQQLGGQDGLTQRLYEQNLDDPARAEAMQERIRAYASRIDSNDIDFWAARRKGSLGLTFLTDKITALAAEQNSAA